MNNEYTASLVTASGEKTVVDKEALRCFFDETDTVIVMTGKVNDMVHHFFGSFAFDKISQGRFENVQDWFRHQSVILGFLATIGWDETFSIEW